METLNILDSDVRNFPDLRWVNQSLATIKYQGNKMVNLPDNAFKDCAKLNTIDLRDNDITAAPHIKWTCINLKILLLSGQQTSDTLPGDF